MVLCDSTLAFRDSHTRYEQPGLEPAPVSLSPAVFVRGEPVFRPRRLPLFQMTPSSSVPCRPPMGAGQQPWPTVETQFPPPAASLPISSGHCLSLRMLSHGPIQSSVLGAASY